MVTNEHDDHCGHDNDHEQDDDDGDQWHGGEERMGVPTFPGRRLFIAAQPH